MSVTLGCVKQKEKIYSVSIISYMYFFSPPEYYFMVAQCIDHDGIFLFTKVWLMYKINMWLKYVMGKNNNLPSIIVKPILTLAVIRLEVSKESVLHYDATTLLKQI